MRVQGTTLAFCALFGAAVILPQAEAEAASKRRAEAHRVGNTAAQTKVAASKRPGHQASTRATQSARSHASAATAPLHARGVAYSYSGRAAYRPAIYGYGGGGGGYISCVPYARMVTGMNVSGNGGHWWYNAAGTYDRGLRPENGSVLAFRATGGMRSGHVAVVERVLGPRHVQIDHANWGGPGIRRGSVMRGVNVIDVSERNDWSAVRVQVGHDGGTFGRVYPTYGFIYNRPDRRMMAGFTGTGGNTGGGAESYALSARYEQVAEIPELNPVPVRRAAAASSSQRRR